MRVLSVTAKCSDMFSASLQGNPADYDGYVPAWFPSTAATHYGDYIELKIDIDTGKILNWRTPTKEHLDETFS